MRQGTWGLASTGHGSSAHSPGSQPELGEGSAPEGTQLGGDKISECPGKPLGERRMPEPPATRDVVGGRPRL